MIRASNLLKKKKKTSAEKNVNTYDQFIALVCDKTNREVNSNIFLHMIAIVSFLCNNFKYPNEHTFLHYVYSCYLYKLFLNIAYLELCCSLNNV